MDVDAIGTLAVGVVNAPMRNFTFRAHAEYFSEPIAASMGVLLTRVASDDGRRLGSTVIDTHNLGELHGVRATPDGFAVAGPSPHRSADGRKWLGRVCSVCGTRWKPQWVQCGGCRSWRCAV